MSRFFRRSERTALYLAADGKCSLCGIALTAGWHADHVHPFSKGGETDVVNGQALCPPCNLSKGTTMTPQLRKWQEEFIHKYGLVDSREFLAVASVGAGKTMAAMGLLSQMPSRNLLVVAPKRNVTAGWCGAAQRFGFTAHDGYEFGLENKVGMSNVQYRVVAVTYQALASSPLIYRKLTSSGDWLIVFDEIHHLEVDGGAWGVAATEAFNTGGQLRRNLRVLGLSGTPWRTAGTQIPFVPYAGNRVAPDYSYRYAAAVADRIVRRPHFVVIDAEARVLSGGEIVDIRLEDARGNDLPGAIRSAIHPESEWMRLAIKTGHDLLLQDRAGVVPNAAMIIHTPNTAAAEKVSDLVRQVTGATPTIVTSKEFDDGPAAASAIEQFANSDDLVLVAVDMASEGTDIPRLTVGIHSTNVRTRLDFEQRFGRLVRLTGREIQDGAQHALAKYIIPAAEPHVDFARSIYEEVDEALRERPERPEKDEDREWEPPVENPVLPASDADVRNIYSDGALVTDLEVWEASGRVARKFGIDQTEVYREMMSNPIPAAPAPVVQPAEDLKAKEAGLRTALNRVVKRVANAHYGRDHQAAWSAVKRRAGVYGAVSSWTIPDIETAIMSATDLLKGEAA